MMQPALLIRLRPTGPWRYGPGDGGPDRTDTVFRSDRLFSAVTLATQQLGWLDEWLGETVHASKPAVAFTSLFPYQNETLFGPPPSVAWPPAAALVRTPSPVFLSKIRWTAARFVPLSLIESMLNGQAILVDQWMLDADSACLVRRDRPSVSPFRVEMRGSAAVDRVTESAVHVHSSACISFEPDSGLWCVARYTDSAAEGRWADRVKACFRLLADSGFGARRSSGWGHSEEPRFQQGSWPNLLVPKLARNSSDGTQNGDNGEASLYWLLSLYSPASTDAIDWGGGDYRLITRGGRVGSTAQPGARKRAVQMIIEGSVLTTHAEPIGTAVDVSPEGFAHPVYRSGFAVALQLPRVGAPDIAPVEPPSDEEALEQRPCDEVSSSTESSGADEAPKASPDPESAEAVDAPQVPTHDVESNDDL